MKILLITLLLFSIFEKSWTQQVNKIYEFQHIIPLDQISNTLDKDFGASVSISGNTAIIGAPRDKTYGDHAGAAYIFKFIDGKWIQTSKLFPSDHYANRRFGYSVSISGNHAIVGVPFSNEYGSGSGAVYFFEFDGINWVQKAKRTSNDPEAWDEFGKSVSISGNNAIVSCEGDGVTFNGSKGAAYIFEFNGNNWFQKEKIVVNDENTSQFGTYVSISGNKAVISSPYDKTFGNYAGAAYIFEYNGTNWIQIKKIYASDLKTNYNFGSSVCIYGNKIIVGAAGAEGKGAAYIFENKGSGWVETVKLNPIDGNSFGYNTYFGSKVAIDDNSAIVKGDLAYYYNYNNQNWEFVSKLVSSNNHGGSGYYNSVSINEDIFFIGAVEAGFFFNKNGNNETTTDNNDKSYIVYPNPSADFVNINFFDTVNYRITIRDINSKLILRQTENFGQSKIDVSSFKNGIYIVELSSDDMNYFIRFQKI